MKIRGRIAAVGVSTPRTRYDMATHRRRIVASWTSAALHPVRSGNAESAITARVRRRGPASWPRGELIVRRGVDATVDGICQASETSR